MDTTTPIVPIAPITGAKRFQFLGRVLFDRTNDTVIHKGDVIQSMRDLVTEQPRLFVVTDLPLTPALEKRVLFRPQANVPRVRPVRPASPNAPAVPSAPTVAPAAAPVQPPMTPVAG